MRCSSDFSDDYLPDDDFRGPGIAWCCGQELEVSAFADYLPCLPQCLKTL